jgi:hypothetical protein
MSEPVAVENVLNQVPTVIQETKAGYKTTEFWSAVVVSLLTLVGTIPVPANSKGLVVGGLAAIYSVARGIAKQGIPAEVPVPTE